SAAEIRMIFTKHGGHMAGANAVKHLFHRKGQILVAKGPVSEDDLMSLALDAGAEDLVAQGDSFEIVTDPHQFEAVVKALESKQIKPISAEVAQVAITPVPVTDERTAKSVLSLIEALEENDDVQNVYSSFDIPDEVMEKVSGGEGA